MSVNFCVNQVPTSTKFPQLLSGCACKFLFAAASIPAFECSDFWHASPATSIDFLFTGFVLGLPLGIFLFLLVLLGIHGFPYRETANPELS